jgi:DNA repair protein RecN (Recombination protein N)
MLKELRIQNLILVSSAVIKFEKGFNVLSGETGAGKSAIMKALYLLAGDKADTSIIRHGAEKAIIEAIFEIDQLPEIAEQLKAVNLDHEAGEDLIIRREISLAGKSRCLINNQAAQLTALRRIGTCLLEMIGQHANQKLLSNDHHRRITDLFGNLEEQCHLFSKSWERQKNLAKELDDLIKNEGQRQRDIDASQQELEEIQNARLKPDEEEELFAEYTRLANADAISFKAQEISQTLHGEKTSVISLLKRQTALFDQLILLDPAFEECAQPLKNSLLEIQEVAYSLEKLSSRVEVNPEKLETIDQRLALIAKLKKKYGKTIEAIHGYAQQKAQNLAEWESADIRIEDNKVQLSAIEQETNALAHELTQKRKKAAEQLAESLTNQLHALNMPKAKFEIDVTPRSRSASGDDEIEFFLIPNVGEKRIPIKEHASGGELSRILLALQTLLAGKEAISTLIFDEIDANIGGATAVIIGEKLREISARHQVLCITHFPQVARQAVHHIQIEKRESEGRTFSHITHLNAQERAKELQRMAGI